MAIVLKYESAMKESKIKFLAQELKKGKIFVLPTSTIYGICANALDTEAVEKIYNVKKRDKSKPLIVLINSLDMLNKLVIDLNENYKKIISKFWPGPLTIVFKKSDVLPSIVSSNNNTIAIRMDSCSIINKLIDISGVPIVAPSANISGNINISSIDFLEKEIYDNVDYIIDNGILSEKEESTLITLEGNNIKVLREGKIKKEYFNNLF